MEYKMDNTANVLDRLRSIKYTITPEEHQLLGINEEDLASFSSEDLQLTPREMQDAIQEIIDNAYQSVPAFKKLVDDDRTKDPKRLGKSSDIISKFLRHLRGALPSHKSSWIKPDTFMQAHDMVQTALQGTYKKKEPTPVVEEQIKPLSDDELKLFNLDRSKIIPEAKWEDIKNNVLFFLNRLKDNAGKRVPNESTKKMPDELKIGLLKRLLNEFRNVKINKFGKLRPFDESWLGKDTNGLKLISKSMVQPPARKPDPVKKEDRIEVLSKTAEVLSVLDRLLDLFRDEKFIKSVDSATNMIDESLPSVSLFEDRLRNIQEEVNKLNLNKSQLAAVLDIDPGSLSYKTNLKGRLEEYVQKIRDIDKTVAEKGESPDLNEKKKAIEEQISNIKDLSTKDISALEEAINDYLDTLKRYREIVMTNLSKANIAKNPQIKIFIDKIDELGREFNRLASEELFKAKWMGRSGFLFRGEKTPVVEKEPPVEKLSADTAVSYAEKLEKYRGTGLRDAFEKVTELIEGESGLPLIKEKMLSIIEARPDNKYNSTGKDYTGNPEGGKEPALEDAVKVVNKLRSLIKKLKVEEKSKEALEILSWAADLPSHIKRISFTKKASFISYLRKMAHMLMCAEDSSEEHKKNINPSGRTEEYKAPGKAGWLIFRERMTKMGKKALQNFFVEPTFVPDFIEEMEKQGLNNMLLHGGEEKPVDIDPILEKVIQKSTGKKGNLENILGNAVAQKYKAEYGIKKTEKELDETRKRIKSLNSKIIETDKSYLPKLEAFSRFLDNPLEATKEYLDQLRGEAPSKKEDKEIEKKEREDKSRKHRENISPSNYQGEISALAKKYKVRSREIEANGTIDVDFSIKKADVMLPGTKDMTIRIPSQMYKQFLVRSTQAKKMYAQIEKEKDPLKRANRLKDYYEYLLNGAKKLNEFLESHPERDISSDKNALKNIEDFLSSEAAKTEKKENIDKAKTLVEEIRASIDKEEKALKVVQQMASIVDEAEIQRQLDTIEADLKDHEVNRLYEVAISPEMNLDPEAARKIKEQEKEHERGLSFLIDRDTYKKNMNRLLTRKLPDKPVKGPSGEIKKTILPSDRKEEADKLRDQIEKDRAELNQRTDFSMKELAFNRLLQDVERLKNILSDTTEEVKDLKALSDNLAYLKANKESLSPDEYKKQKATLNKALEDRGIDEGLIKSLIVSGEKYAKNLEEIIRNVERTIPPAKAELDRMKSKVIKEKTPSENLKELKDRLTKLKVENMSIMTRADLDIDQRKKRKEEIEEEIAKVEEQIKNFMTPRTAAEEKDLSPYEKALETRGTKPAPYMTELPKPKGWEVIENFFREAKRERRALEGIKEDKEGVPQIARKYITRRLERLERMIPAIDAYKKQIVNIGGDTVKLEDAVSEFEDLLFDYQGDLRKYTNQRDDAIERARKLSQEIDLLKDLFDPDTGEFKGLDKEEIENIKKIFLGMLYNELERYWATKVGKNISVFGERDTEWYNNVYRTFKNMAGARGNKKYLGLINQYKQETRSDFDDLANRLKSQELEKRRDTLVKRFKDLGGDPEKSETIKLLNTRIDTLKKQEDQIRKIFEEMAGAVLADINSKTEKEFSEKIPEDKPKSKVDLDKKTKKKSEDAVSILEAEFDDLLEADKALKEVENILNKGEEKLGIGKVTEDDVLNTLKSISTLSSEVIQDSVSKYEKGEFTAEKMIDQILNNLDSADYHTRPQDKIRKYVAEHGAKALADLLSKTPIEKLAYNKLHRDFNLKILYSPTIQSKIAEMINSKVVA